MLTLAKKKAPPSGASHHSYGTMDLHRRNKDYTPNSARNLVQKNAVVTRKLARDGYNAALEKAKSVLGPKMMCVVYGVHDAARLDIEGNCKARS